MPWVFKALHSLGKNTFAVFQAKSPLAWKVELKLTKLECSQTSYWIDTINLNWVPVQFSVSVFLTILKVAVVYLLVNLRHLWIRWLDKN